MCFCEKSEWFVVKYFIVFLYQINRKCNFFFKKSDRIKLFWMQIKTKGNNQINSSIHRIDCSGGGSQPPPHRFSEA